MRALTILLVLLCSTPLWAIERCHDYSWFRAFGENVNTKTPGELRAKLKAAGYKKFNFTNAAKMPDKAMRSLKPGYVILLDSGGHSGYVNSDGKIDHFIQLQGEVGKKRATDQLPKAPVPNNAGGLFLGDTLKQMIHRRFKKNPGKVEVWRKI